MRHAPKGGSPPRLRAIRSAPTSRRMTDERLDAAMERLEHALARAERAAAAREAAAGSAQALARLEERHARLRGRVRETIERLDALIDDGAAAR